MTQNAAAQPTMTRVSVGPGGAQASGDSRGGAISADGRWVAFASWASDLVPGDTNGEQDIFLYDHSMGFDENGRSLGRLRATGLRPKFLDKLAHENVKVDPMLFAMDGI